MSVEVMPTEERGVRGSAVGDDTVRSKVISAELRVLAGPYTKGGFPVTAKQFGLRQLRDLRAEPTDRYWFAFELAGARTPDEDSSRGTVRVFTSAEVEDGTELPAITTTAIVEGI
jgi:hypothetical protein